MISERIYSAPQTKMIYCGSRAAIDTEIASLVRKNFFLHAQWFRLHVGLS